MTATPRIYGDTAKATAERDNVTLCSMDDDETLRREPLHPHVLRGREAAASGRLQGHRSTVDQKHIGERIQKLLKDENNQLRMDDAGKIVGCWKALGKQGLAGQLLGDTEPMKRAVAFCQVIEAEAECEVHKIASKQIAEMFGRRRGLPRRRARRKNPRATLHLRS